MGDGRAVRYCRAFDKRKIMIRREIMKNVSFNVDIFGLFLIYVIFYAAVRLKIFVHLTQILECNENDKKVILC